MKKVPYSNIWYIWHFKFRICMSCLRRRALRCTGSETGRWSVLFPTDGNVSHPSFLFFLLPFPFPVSFCLLLSLTPQESDQHPDLVGWCDNEAIRARFGDSKSKADDRDAWRKEGRPIQVPWPSDLNLEKDTGWKKAQKIGQGHVLQWMRTSQRRGPCEMIDLTQIVVCTYSSTM